MARGSRNNRARLQEILDRGRAQTLARAAQARPFSGLPQGPQSAVGQLVAPPVPMRAPMPLVDDPLRQANAEAAAREQAARAVASREQVQSMVPLGQVTAPFVNLATDPDERAAVGRAAGAAADWLGDAGQAALDYIGGGQVGRDLTNVAQATPDALAGLPSTLARETPRAIQGAGNLYNWISNQADPELFDGPNFIGGVGTLGVEYGPEVLRSITVGPWQNEDRLQSEMSLTRARQAQGLPVDPLAIDSLAGQAAAETGWAGLNLAFAPGDVPAALRGLEVVSRPAVNTARAIAENPIVRAAGREARDAVIPWNAGWWAGHGVGASAGGAYGALTSDAPDLQGRLADAAAPAVAGWVAGAPIGATIAVAPRLLGAGERILQAARVADDAPFAFEGGVPIGGEIRFGSRGEPSVINPVASPIDWDGRDLFIERDLGIRNGGQASDGVPRGNVPQQGGGIGARTFANDDVLRQIQGGDRGAEERFFAPTGHNGQNPTNSRLPDQRAREAPFMVDGSNPGYVRDLANDPFDDEIMATIGGRAEPTPYDLALARQKGSDPDSARIDTIVDQWIESFTQAHGRPPETTAELDEYVTTIRALERRAGETPPPPTRLSPQDQARQRWGVDPLTGNANPLDDGIGANAAAAPSGRNRWQAAVRDPETGEVYVGANHADAISNAPEERWDALYETAQKGSPNYGFVSPDGGFSTYEEAMASLGEGALGRRHPPREGTFAGERNPQPEEPLANLGGTSPERNETVRVPISRVPADNHVGYAERVAAKRSAIREAIESGARNRLEIQRAVQERLGETPRASAVDRVASEMGVELEVPNTGRQPRAQQAEALRLLREGKHPVEVARATGYGRQAVADLARREGIAVPNLMGSPKLDRNQRILDLRNEFGRREYGTAGGPGGKMRGSATDIAAILRGESPLPDGSYLPPAERDPSVTQSVVLGVWNRADKAGRAAPSAAPIENLARADDVASEAQRAGVSESAVSRFSIARNRDRIDPLLAIGAGAGGSALLFAPGEADAQSRELRAPIDQPNMSSADPVDYRRVVDIDPNTYEVRERFLLPDGTLVERVRRQDRATTNVTSQRFYRIDDAHPPEEVPLTDEERARISRILRQTSEGQDNNPIANISLPQNEDPATTPAWAFAAPALAGLLGGRIGRVMARDAGHPLAGQLLGGTIAGLGTGVLSGAATDAEDMANLGGLGALEGLLATGGGSALRSSARWARDGLQGLDFVPRAAAQADPLDLIPPPVSRRFADRPIDEESLGREMDAQTILRGRDIKPTRITAEERADLPEGARGGLAGRLRRYGIQGMRLMAREAGVPETGSARELSQRLADAARQDPTVIQGWRRLFPTLSITGLAVTGATRQPEQEER